LKTEPDYNKFFIAGTYGQFIVTIISNPAGTPVSGSTNTFDYPILSSVTLTCMVGPSPPAGATYQWNTQDCFTNARLTTPSCFPTGQTTQSVTGNNLLAEDAGTITCTVTIGGVEYLSEQFTLRISGMHQTRIYIMQQQVFFNILTIKHRANYTLVYKSIQVLLYIIFLLFLQNLQRSSG